MILAAAQAELAAAAAQADQAIADWKAYVAKAQAAADQAAADAKAQADAIAAADAARAAALQAAPAPLQQVPAATFTDAARVAADGARVAADGVGLSAAPPVPPPPTKVGPITDTVILDMAKLIGWHTTASLRSAVVSLIAVGVSLLALIHPGHLASSQQFGVTAIGAAIAGVMEISHSYGQSKVTAAAVSVAPTLAANGANVKVVGK